MIVLDVDSGEMSVGRFPFYCKRMCNLSASTQYYLVDTSRRFTGTIPLEYLSYRERQGRFRKSQK